MLADIQTGVDENGHPVLTGDMGPIQFNAYTSEDGSYVIQVDTPSIHMSEHPSLRIYLNDTTVYDSNVTPIKGA